MWLLLPAAGLLAVVCCLNGYLVYRKLCDKEAAAGQQQSRSLKRQTSDLALTVKVSVQQWTESSTGQLMVASTVLAVCLYICLDTRMRAHPEVLLPFLVIYVCSLGGFVTYRYLAWAKMRQGPETPQLQPQIKLQGDSAADFSSSSRGIKWYDDWQKQSSRITPVLVFSVGLASFQQSIKAFSAGTQLIITSCLAIPLCSLAGFMMYLSSRPHQETSSAEELQQNKQKLAAGLGMLLAFTAGFMGLKSSMGVPVILVACFLLPVCCLAGFWMYQYQLYLNPPQSTPASPQQYQSPPADAPGSTQPYGDAALLPDRSVSRERLRQNSDIFMMGNQATGRSPYATRQSQDVQQQQDWDHVQPDLQRQYGDLRGVYVPDIPDGEEHQHWADGSEYYGEWQDGQPNGRGIYVSKSGDRYEGEWRDGKEHGAGTAVAADGSSFYGTWQNGKRHGEGVHKPASNDNNRADIIFLRDYEFGVLSNETVLRMADKDAHRKNIKKDRSRKPPERKPDPSIPKPGEHIYKGHRSYDLMRELQLGIMFSIANASKSRVTLIASDVTQEAFGLEVSQYLRGHNGSSFKWKDYSPLVFQRLRQLFGIDNMDYLLSLTGDRALRLLASPGKSGSAFFLSDDDRFLIKTVQQEEMRLLLELIPKYYRHVEENSGTLLTRFHGLHMVKPCGSHGAKARARFVVMGNVFPTDVRLHRRYDLKGSTLGRTSARKAGDPNTVLKDLDIDFQLVLNAATYDQLMEQLQRDTALLESLRVMDYSLLLGVHYLSWGPDQWAPPEIKKVGSGISRAAASANNPLHWFSGGHTHKYPRCDNDESAPVTPSAAMTASSDAGPVSMVSSIDDSALKGTPRSPDPVTNGLASDDNDETTWATKACIALQQPLQDDSRQHSWTAGRPTPKYRPAAHSPSHMAPRAHQIPRISPGLQTLAPLHENSIYNQTPSLSPSSAEEEDAMQYPGAVGQGLAESTGPVFTSFPPLSGPPIHAQTDHSQSAAATDWGSQPDVVTAGAAAMARASPPPHHLALRYGQGNVPEGSAQQGHMIRDSPPRAVSPFESVAELPFTPPQRVQSILTSHQSDRVHFEENPLFVPLDSPDGAGYRNREHHVHYQEAGRNSIEKAGLVRTRSAPMRPRTSIKGCSQSPTRQEMHAFEALLDGTDAQMPNRMQLLATYSMSSQEEQQSIYHTGACRIGTDEATGSMRRLYSRRCRDRPGVSIPALAVPRDGSSPSEPVLIYFGIIDFLQEYRTKKRMEHVMKAAVFGGKTISVVDPHRYAKRFRGFMEELFVRK